MITSGTVPRELAPGVIWDQAAEKDFVEKYNALMTRKKPFSNVAITSDFDVEKTAIQEAVWSVEIRLHQIFIKRRIMEADTCRAPFEKKRLVEKWSGLYGKRVTERLLRMVRNHDFRRIVLRDW